MSRTEGAARALGTWQLRVACHLGSCHLPLPTSSHVFGPLPLPIQRHCPPKMTVPELSGIVISRNRPSPQHLRRQQFPPTRPRRRAPLPLAATASWRSDHLPVHSRARCGCSELPTTPNYCRECPFPRSRTLATHGGSTMGGGRLARRARHRIHFIHISVSPAIPL